MLLSCFTPTHNPSHLPEVFRSLQQQRDVNWEWVISPNGPAIGKIPEAITKDPRVKIVPYHLEKDEKPKIGKLKRFACDAATGDAFIELDHDDMLVPNAMQRIAQQFDKGADFVYSDAAVFMDRDDMIWPTGYSERYGWETYEFRVFGRDLLATRAFDVTPRALSEVYYAPDHVRAWSREAYYKAGGHDPNMTVGDDHDLICRTYLMGGQFAHTGSCCYLYREHPGNTVKSHNAEIQRQQNANRDKYFYKLIDEWVRRHKLNYLDLKRSHPKVKFTGDGKLRLKFDDNSIGCIRAFDFLQFTKTEDYLHTWNEIYRVLVPGGWICTSTPSTRGNGAWAPHHRSGWNEGSFNYVSDIKYSLDLGVEWPVARFQRARCWTAHPSPGHKSADMQYVYADLCALKGQRQPGLVRI